MCILDRNAYKTHLEKEKNPRNQTQEVPTYKHTLLWLVKTKTNTVTSLKFEICVLVPRNTIYAARLSILVNLKKLINSSAWQ